MFIPPRVPPYMLLAPLLVSNAMVAHAAEWYVEPSLTTSTVYDDNRRLSTDGSEDSGTELRVRPAIVFGRATPSLDVRGSAELDVTRSSDGDVNDENLDDTDQFFRLLSNYRTPRHNWRLDASLRRDTTLRDSIASAASDAVAPPDAPDVSDPDIGQDDVRVRRNLIRVDPSWDWRVTERTDLSLEYNLLRVNYGNTKSTTLNDSTSHRGTVTLSRRLSEVDTMRGIVTVRTFENDNSEEEFDTYTLGLGYRRDFSETFFADVNGGVTHLNVREGDSNDGNGFAAIATVQKEFETSTLRTIFQRVLQPSGSGTPLVRNQIDVRWNGTFRPRWSYSLAARAFRQNRSGGSGSSTDDDRWYAQLDPQVQWAFTRNLSFGLGYRFRWQDRDDRGSGTSNAVTATVRYAWERTSVSR